MLWHDVARRGIGLIRGLPRERYSDDELGMLFEEGNPLVPCVNAALSTLRDNGTLASLEEQWLNQGGDIPTLSN